MSSTWQTWTGPPRFNGVARLKLRHMFPSGHYEKERREKEVRKKRTKQKNAGQREARASWWLQGSLSGPTVFSGACATGVQRSSYQIDRGHHAGTLVARLSLYFFVFAFVPGTQQLASSHWYTVRAGQRPERNEVLKLKEFVCVDLLCGLPCAYMCVCVAFTFFLYCKVFILFHKIRE